MSKFGKDLNEGMTEALAFARTRADGTIVEVMEDGTERPFPQTSMRPMTDAEWQAARKVPRTKTLRRVLGLTQEVFAARYQIPLGMLRDWEQGKAEPDQSARAYLRTIAGDPVAVHHALHAAPRPR